MKSHATAQSSQEHARDTRADNRADMLRVLAALALLAFISSFDGAGEQPSAPEARAAATPFP